MVSNLLNKISFFNICIIDLLLYKIIYKNEKHNQNIMYYKINPVTF